MTSDWKGKRQRTTLIFFASFSIFVYAGAFYGWGPMQLLLEQNGNFATKCPDGWNEGEQESENEVCSEQTAALLTCRFVGQLTVLTGPLWGYLSDRFGGHILTEIMGLTTVIGLVLLLCAVEFPGTGWDSVLYAAFILVGVGSTCGALLTVETGLLFHDDPSVVEEGGSATSNRAQSRVIALLNSLFDAGAMTYLSLWGLEKVSSSPSTEVSTVTAIVGGYLGFAVLCLGGYVYMFRLVSRQQDAASLSITNSDDDVIEKPVVESKRTETFHGESTLHGSTANDCALASDTVNSTTIMPTDASVHRITEDNTCSGNATPEGAMDLTDKTLTNDAKYDCDPEDNKDSSEPLPSASSDETYVPIAQRSFPDQLRSQAYIMLCVFFSFHMVGNVWTLTTARDFLKSLGDDEYGNRYLSIFTLMTPVSLVALPFVDVAIHKFGFGWALQGVNFLGIVHGIIKVSSTNLNVQIVGFLVFSFFRCFLFAVTFSCMPSFISEKSIGRGIGVFYVVSGVASFINIPLANMAVERLNGDFFIPNLLLLLMTPSVIYVTYLIGKALVRDRESYRKRS